MRETLFLFVVWLFSCRFLACFLVVSSLVSIVPSPLSRSLTQDFASGTLRVQRIQGGRASADAHACSAPGRKEDHSQRHRRRTVCHEDDCRRIRSGERRSFLLPTALSPLPLFSHLTQSGGSEAIASAMPLQRIGSAPDVYGMVAWLSSQAGVWVTGAIIPLDGGALVTPRL